MMVDKILQIKSFFTAAMIHYYFQTFSLSLLPYFSKLCISP